MRLLRAPGCPIYTRAEVIGDTVVHCVGVPFAFTAAYVMISTATARLGEVRPSTAAQHTAPHRTTAVDFTQGARDGSRGGLRAVAHES